MVLVLAAAPTAAVAHLESTAPDVQATYEMSVARVDVSYAARGENPPRGWVYGLISVWVEGHDGADPTRQHIVYGPAKFSPGRPNGRGVVKDVISLGRVAYRHTDCTPAETMYIELLATLLRRQGDVPRRLRAPHGRRLRPSAVEQVETILADGRRLPGALGPPELDTDDDVDVAARGRLGRFTVRVAGDAAYEESPTSCPEEPANDEEGTGPTASSLEVRDIGYEHPDPPVNGSPYSAVCANVTHVGGSEPAEIAAQLQVSTPGGWVDEGVAKTLVLAPGASAVAKFGIDVPDRTYRIVATGPGGLSASSAGIDVGAGSPPRQTRDCHPPG